MPQINEVKKAGKRREKMRRLIISVFLVGVILVLGIGGLLLVKAREVTGVSVVEARMILMEPLKLLQNTNRMTNVLILGKAGGDHAGTELTDMMLVGSFLVGEKPRLATLTIPRDLWSNELQDKINSAYYYGKTKPEGQLAFVKRIVSEYTGLPIHYVMLVDFSGFEKLIDTIGRVDVMVERGFTDWEYPIAGKEDDECNGDINYRCRFETLVFESGLQKMNGEKALKFVRSRHANGDEGTDFARGRRQQAVITALKSKFTDLSTWKNLDKSKQIINNLLNILVFDGERPELYALGMLLLKIDKTNQHSVSIEDSLFVPQANLYGGRYVLIPRGTMRELQETILERLISF